MPARLNSLKNNIVETGVTLLV